MRKALLYVMVTLTLGCVFMTSLATPAFAEQIEDEPQVVVTHDRGESGVGSYRDVDVVSRAWYGASLNLLIRAQSSVHNFDGNNVGIEMTCSSSGGGIFTVTLYRSAGGSASRIGSATFARNGFTKATWPNVGPGSYYFVFSKSNDGVRVTSSDVAMYSW